MSSLNVKPLKSFLNMMEALSDVIEAAERIASKENAVQEVEDRLKELVKQEKEQKAALDRVADDCAERIQAARDEAEAIINEAKDRASEMLEAMEKDKAADLAEWKERVDEAAKEILAQQQKLESLREEAEIEETRVDEAELKLRQIREKIQSIVGETE